MTEIQGHNVWAGASLRARRSTVTVLAILLAVTGFLASGSSPARGAAADLAQLDLARTELANCQLLLGVATSNAQRNRARNCITDQRAIIEALTITTSPTATTSPSTSPSPTGTTPSPTPTPTPTPSPTPTGTWPSPSTVGVPAGTVLTAYSGPCIITTPNTVIDAKHVSCALTIQTTGVRITRSIVDGGILTGRSDVVQPVRLTVEDSRLIGTNGRRAIDGSAYVVRRSHLSSELSGGWCWRFCVVEGSYIEAAGDHTSAFRLQRDGVLRGNVLWCKRDNSLTDGGCSGDLVSYADVIDGQQTVIDGNMVTGNLFKATPGWYCLRAGNGTNWTITDNTFERGAGSCSEQSGGAPVTAYNPGGVGNVWTSNRYTDGALILV